MSTTYPETRIGGHTDNKTYSISELAREFQITPRAIRFYEDKGLVSPTRLGQVRQFSGRDRVRLALIVSGKKVGFSLADIKEMLDLYDLDDNRLTQLQVSIKKFRQRIEELKQQRIEIEEAIGQLTDACHRAENHLIKAKDKQEMQVVGYGVRPDASAS